MGKDAFDVSKAISPVALIQHFNDHRIPLVLIGAKACNVLGSSRLSGDMDWAARIVDADQIIDLMYELDYRMPLSVDSNQNVTWAEKKTVAKNYANRAKLGALNFYLRDEQGEVIDQIDFVFENPVPFAILKRDAAIVSENPRLACASVDHLIQMKEKRIAEGKGKDTDHTDIQFLQKVKSKKKGGK